MGLRREKVLFSLLVRSCASPEGARKTRIYPERGQSAVLAASDKNYSPFCEDVCVSSEGGSFQVMKLDE